MRPDEVAPTEDANDPPLLRFGLCSRGHDIRWKSDLIERRDGFHCRRCVADALAERAAHTR